MEVSSKYYQRKATLVYALDQILKLLHPFMPFVTEEIYEHIPGVEGSIAIADYPTVQDEFVDEQAKCGDEYSD